MQITKNFHFSEFDCKDGSPVPRELRLNVIELAFNLQIIREAIGKPIIINSAYRTPEYNKSIGGASKSQHLLGKAADIRVTGLTAKELHQVIEGLIKKGEIKEGGLGLYNTFVHYDTYFDGKKARRWDFRK